MKFPFAVKHNGVLYEPGKVVPIGQEPKKEVEIEDKTATELSKELKERFDIDMAPQMGKAKLLEALEDAENKMPNPMEDIEDKEPTEGEDNKDEEPTDGENNEESFLDKIINE